jgi:hypothetical protein
MKHKVKRVHFVGIGGALRAGSGALSRFIATGCDRPRAALAADTAARWGAK